MLFSGIRLMLTKVLFGQFFKIVPFYPYRGLTKVLFNANILTKVLFCGIRLMLTKVLIIAPSVALDYR